MSFIEELEKDKERRKAICFVLAYRECFVIPIADIAGWGAPKMLAPSGHAAIIIPDYYIIQSAKTGFVEHKFKAEPTLHRMTDTLEHGFSRRKWLQYRKCQTVNQVRCFILIEEEKSGEILVASLDKLGEPRIFPPEDWPPNKPLPKGVDEGGMAYWPRNRFQVFFAGPPRDLPMFRYFKEPVPPTLPECSDLRNA